MRKYLICLALATFAFTVGVILFNGQTAQPTNRQLVSTPNLRTGAATDSTMQQSTSDSDDSGIIEGTTLDDNGSDEGNVNPYEPVIADPSGWSDVEGSTSPVTEASPIVEETAGTPETEAEAEHIIEEVGSVIPIDGPEEPSTGAPVVEENNGSTGVPVIEENNPASAPIVEENNGTPETESIIEEAGSVIPVDGPLDASDSDSGVTPGIVIEAPTPSQGSDSGDDSDSGRGVIEVQPISEPESGDPTGEAEVADPSGDGVTEGEVVEVSLPTPSVNGGDEGNDSGVIEVIQPSVINDPAPTEVEGSDPVIESGVTEGEILEVSLPTPSVNGGDEGNDSGVIEVTEPVIISEPVPTEAEVADVTPESTD